MSVRHAGTDHEAGLLLADLTGYLMDEIKRIDLAIRGLRDHARGFEINDDNFEPLLVQLRRTIRFARIVDRRIEANGNADAPAVLAKLQAEEDAP